MNMTSIGDLANTLMLRQRSVQLKQDITVLTQELNTGQVADVSARLGGDVSYLTDIDRNLERLDGYAIASREAGIFAQTAQASLERIRGLATSISGSLLGLGEAGSSKMSSAHMGMQAEQDIASAISALNASVGGRSLFAGVATDRAPLGSADTLLGALRTEVAGLVTAGDVTSAVDAWFASPAGFEATMYAGSDQVLAPMHIGSGEEVSLALTAQDPVFRETLRNMALVALAGDEALGFDKGTRDALFMTAANGLLADQVKLTSVQADLGFAEARIEEISTRNAAARTGLEYSRNALLEADPYETATRLEETQFRLESLYAVTVRSANLSLLNFLS